MAHVVANRTASPSLSLNKHRNEVQASQKSAAVIRFLSFVVSSVVIKDWLGARCGLGILRQCYCHSASQIRTHPPTTLQCVSEMLEVIGARPGWVMVPPVA